MSNGWKIAVVVLAILVAYLAYRDYARAQWMRKELYVDWIEFNSFKYDPPGTNPSDPTKPPPPPPPFGF